jgi:hypothetical protein
MIDLDDIPTASVPPSSPRPSPMVARIRSVRPSRRTVLRGLVVGATAAVLVPIDWLLDRREAAAAVPARGRAMSEHRNCAPTDYDVETNNWPNDGPAVCYGGWRRGSFPCEDGYHREGRYERGNEQVESTRLATNCEGRNAWRWKGHRCSDAITEVMFEDGEYYTGVTIAACALPEQDSAAVPLRESTSRESALEPSDDERNF